MSIMGQLIDDFVNYWQRRRDQNLQWCLGRHDDVTELRRAKAMAEQALVAQLKKQAQQLAHDLAVNKIRNVNDLAMVKVQCKQELKDYQQYLQSLDRLKESLRNSYSHLPEAVAFTIHHHAKQLLHRMWEAEEGHEKMKVEMQLLQFMAAVHEDSRAALQGETNDGLPQNALAFIDADSVVK